LLSTAPSPSAISLSVKITVSPSAFTPVSFNVAPITSLPFPPDASTLLITTSYLITVVVVVVDVVVVDVVVVEVVVDFFVVVVVDVVVVEVVVDFFV